MRLPLISAITLVLATPAASYAVTPHDARTSVPVSLYGLDLSQPDDAARMLRRLDRAATEACGAGSASLREYQWAVRRSDCHAASLDRAVARLDAPAVTALYAEERSLEPATND